MKAANTAFIWTRPQNSAISVTATHRMTERVPDGTGTQVWAWMFNKWKAKIVQRGLYNRKNSLWRKAFMKGGWKKEKRKHCSNLNNYCNHCHPICTRTELLGLCRGQTFLYKLGSFLFGCLKNPF